MDEASGQPRVVIGGDTPLASFGPVLSAKVARDLRKLGVEQHMGSIVARVDAGGLLARGPDGTVSRHPAGAVLWTAGVQAPALAQAIAGATGADRDHAGRIRVGGDLTIPGHPEIYVLGDLMSPDGLPGVAEVAMRSGLYAGRCIRRTVAGRGSAKPFRYRDLGSAACICRGRAVVSAGPLRMGGFLGWWAWLFIHIGFLAGFRNRAGALLSWWLAFTRDLRQERAFTIAEVGTVPDVYADRPWPGHGEVEDVSVDPGEFVVHRVAGRHKPIAGHRFLPSARAVAPALSRVPHPRRATTPPRQPGG
jgi:NADH:quinone reductase (non-electrogenic)